MRSCKRRLCGSAVAGVGVLLGVSGAARAKVAVQGNVAWWNPESSQYEPLKRARVRIVLAESYDYDTGDVETTTNDGGAYRITKGNAWWKSGYKAYAIVFAEVPDKLEIQSHYLQVDGYQAATGKVFAHDNKTKVLDVRIGGPQANVNYHVGGIAALDNADSTDATHGWRAFVLCNDMTEHRLSLMARGIGNGNFEEKEVSFPYNDAATASYQQPWDYIRFPDSYFDTSLARVSKGARHELSHGVMADMYTTWPGFLHGSAGSHSLGKVAERREFAWSEAWAEFLGQVTQQDAFASTYGDFETQAGTMPDNFAAWRDAIPANADRSYVEGEIVSALWDIYDGQGLETRMDQVAEIPGEEQFWDGISDGSLSKIWGIFSDKHPHSFTHESFLGKSDSLVWYWVHNTNYGQHHELKSILFNRGIRVNELQQHVPSVKMGAVAWEGYSVKIPIQVTEPDSEDRPNVKVELFVNGKKVSATTLKDGWNGQSNSAVITQSFGWKQGTPKPEFLVAASDDMQSGWDKQTLSPPASASVSGLAVELLGVYLDNPVESKMLLGDFGQQVSNLKFTISASSGGKSASIDVPPINAAFGKSVSNNKAQEVLRTTEIGDSITVTLKGQGVASPDVKDGAFKVDISDVPLKVEAGQSFDVAQGYGLGVHTMSLNLMPAYVKVPGAGSPFQLHASISYRIFPVSEEKKFPFLFPIETFTPIKLLLTIPAEDAPGTPKPLPKTPGAMVCRANSLLRQVARLQTNLIEVTNELQWKSSAQGIGREGRKEADAREPQVLEMAAPDNAPIAPLLRPNLVQREGVLKLPEMAFLDQAARGEGMVKELDAAARAGLDDLALSISSIQTRLDQASSDSAQLKIGLEAYAVEEGRARRATGAARLAPGSRFDGRAIADLTQRLAQVPLAVQSATPILAKQRAVIGVALQRVRPGAVSARFTELPLQRVEVSRRFKLGAPEAVTEPTRERTPTIRPRDGGGIRVPPIRRLPR